MIRKTLLTLAIAVGALYLLNAAVIFFSKPVSVQFDSSASRSFKDFGSVSIRLVEDLHSGGVGPWSASVMGYVNVMDDSQIIYVKKENVNSDFSQASLLYKHEFAHVLQKEMVAEKAGGYPTYVNPLQSAVYYYHLLQLNHDFEMLMPDVNKTTRPFLPSAGLEAAAECYAQPRSGPEEVVYYKAHYLYPEYCTAEQRMIAIKMISGTWPAPLSPEEKAKLQKENIITEKPSVNLQESIDKILDISLQLVKETQNQQDNQ